MSAETTANPTRKIAVPAQLSSEEIAKWVGRITVLLCIEIVLSLLSAASLSALVATIISEVGDGSAGPDVAMTWGVTFLVMAAIMVTIPILAIFEVRSYRPGKVLVLNWIAFILMAMTFGALIVVPVIHFYFIYKLTMQRKTVTYVEGVPQPEAGAAVPEQTPEPAPHHEENVSSAWGTQANTGKKRPGPKGIEKVGR